MRNRIKIIVVLLGVIKLLDGLREFRSYSIRAACAMANDANYPFAYSKYSTQTMESKGRVNSNLQDFRHQCGVLGGRSKCNICEDVECKSDLGICHLQLQGVNSSEMSSNVPTLSDTSWAIGGRFRHDYGGENVTHFCVFISTGNCTHPFNQDFSNCDIRCFGHGFIKPARKNIAPPRTHVDVYPGMGQWPDDGQVDLWEYPRNCSDLKKYEGQNCTYSGKMNAVPSFNPQGFTFSVAGTGSLGFRDGAFNVAQFNFPEDVAVDEYGNIYVADTKNNAIRKVAHNGYVTTIAGRGPSNPGFKDGPCTSATFTIPKGVDVRHELVNGITVVVIIVADTGNHRIRRIEINNSTGTCIVKCLTGLCGNNTLSATGYKSKAVPLSGYADGSGLYARFSAPESVTFMEGDVIVVADTGNFLIRWVVASTGNTSTLAGTVAHGETDSNGNPVAGCTPPCLVGMQGFLDGNLTHAQFYNPLDVTRGPNNTVWVADEQRIRIIELPSIITNIYSIRSRGRVSTIAGDSLQGHDDGIGQQSTFFYSSGLTITSDNIVYVTDAASCRLRRVSPMPLVSVPLTCTTRATELIRPSGCTSFDQPYDKIGRKVSRVERNIQYSFSWPNEKKPDAGKYIQNCVGVPPRDRLDKHFLNITGDNLVIDDNRVTVNEDSEQGMSIIASCPSGCNSATYYASSVVEGTVWYSEISSVCRSAIHAGILGPSGGYVQIILERRDYLDTLSKGFLNGTIKNGIKSNSMNESSVYRVFTPSLMNISTWMVHTIAGHPSAPLESACSYAEGQPATLAHFNNPSGITASFYSSLSNSTLLYVADTNNHRIRAVSATCTLICENGGVCTGPDICRCQEGWQGVDCTKPICSSECATNKVCVAPDTCKCKPGYHGTNCNIAQCVQSCQNGGYCSAPDTCSCPSGWFDSNCTTPVCRQTCANGGNCTAPNTCACPSEWSGQDCRIPVCNQVCKNRGYCVAPNTCICPPQWTNYDCSVPVCHQGFFVANVEAKVSNNLYAKRFLAYPTFKNCDIQSWCNATHEFECDQTAYVTQPIELPSGPEYRAITGRKTPPTECMNIELPLYYKIPFQLSNADNTTTGDVRYSQHSPYLSDSRNPWRGYYVPTAGHTGPWVYEPDRQVANVNWLNTTQGYYACANGGLCVEPDVCTCAEGWIGFDCRTPVCNVGYYKPNQTQYVSGEETHYEVERFQEFMGNNSYLLYWPYSNPNYTTQIEFHANSDQIVREIINITGTRYYGPMELNSSGGFSPRFQGGYRCSIRAFTEWEREGYVFSHPNFYSRYMNFKRQVDNISYTYWEGLDWPPTHRKSRVLDEYTFNISFSFTNEGWRRKGIWNRTAHDWQYGVCVVQFFRNCSSDPLKQLDLESNRYGVYVQDTDLAFRPRIFYDDYKVTQHGRWNQAGGSCVDNVVRGCYNNGTCVAPNTCRCSTGWTGQDCMIPKCEQNCHHHGNCTSPNICTCEKGWAGNDCSTPLCAQECQNLGVCIAPDTCQCLQYPNTFRDGRIAGGRPLFQDQNGDPLASGWTGFDCSVPICVQAQTFLLNVPDSSSSGFVTLGGHGADGLLTCTDSSTGLTLPRCPQYSSTTTNYVTANDGTVFQTGCGYDPFDTGCCILGEQSAVSCYKCAGDIVRADNYTFFCAGGYTTTVGVREDQGKFAEFLDSNQNFKLCGKYHKPRDYSSTTDYGTGLYYKNVLYPSQSSFNFRSNYTSNRFLCHVQQWVQGDYIDSAGYGSTSGAGTIYGLENGRTVRINDPNIIINVATNTFTRGPIIRGEGIYECYNQASCIGPDVCTCNDGYEGYDCNTPLCRHLQPSGAVTSCLNGGVCISRDFCQCIQTGSVLWEVHPQASRGSTGWTGSDCSIPMCVQGFYDPFCSDLPQAPAGEGCYRCSNGGNCTAPDVCTCGPGWTGFDCKTPVCEVVADPLTRTQLGTVYEEKVVSFETDPCGLEAIYGLRGWKGRKYARGNCTEPNQCTCLCKLPYDKKTCSTLGTNCNGPWQDPMVKLRDVLTPQGPEFTFGSSDCEYGYEGNVDNLDRWTTCHQTIFVPTQTQRDSVTLIISFSICGFFFLVFYRFAAARLKRRFLLAKIERRRSKRSSEDSLTKAGAFSNT